MAALTDNRNTFERGGDVLSGPVAAGVLIYAGALVVRDAAGNLLPGTPGAGDFGVGRAEERVDNTGGAAGDATVRVKVGKFRFNNSAGANAIARANIGAVAWIVDDNQVALADGGGTRSPAGIVHDVDDQGVWVRFDEVLTRLAAA
ncbi:MAG: hypothetical protein AAFY65_13110 [Pseudomonadota bacterium]